MKTITTHDELEALPPGAVVRDSDGITDDRPQPMDARRCGF